MRTLNRNVGASSLRAAAGECRRHLHAAKMGFIITVVDRWRFTMCHDWWYRRMYDEREASRKLWDEFEQTQPLSDPEATDEEAEIRLEQPNAEPAVAEKR